jgi:hypothetical protein
LPAVSTSTAPEIQKQESASKEIIDAFLGAHKQAPANAPQTNSSELRVGSLALPLAALSADGNAVNASGPWPKHLQGKTVLLVFWSATDADSLRQIDQLKKMRQEVSREDFQIVSLCVDRQWAPWMRIVTQRMDYGQGELRPHDDSRWWQLIQDPNAPGTAQSYGATKLPSSFIIGPDRRLLAVSVPSSELPSTLHKLLK